MRITNTIAPISRISNSGQSKYEERTETNDKRELNEGQFSQ